MSSQQPCEMLPTTPSVLPPMSMADLSEREEWALRMAQSKAWTGAEHRELLDFLNYPASLDNVVRQVFLRILEARVCGEHIN